MERDMDLIRNLLLLIEERGNSPILTIENLAIDGYSEQQLSHHVWMLRDGGMILADETPDAEDEDVTYWQPRCLTWNGHEFLENIRDRDTWTQTITAAKSGGVAVTVSALAQIATAIMQKKLERLIGVND